MRLAPALAGLTVVAVLLSSPRSAAAIDEGWTIERFDDDIAIQTDGSIRVRETIEVDFGFVAKHGIFRYIPVEYDYDSTHLRLYRLDLDSITDTAGREWSYERSRQGTSEYFKIGDPNRTIIGRHTYVITYRVRGVLNAFADHDELYWNVNGADWPVQTRSVTARVSLPGEGFQQAICFQGEPGSTAACAFSVDTAAQAVTYRATKTFAPGEQLTIAVAFRKGLVPKPAPILQRKPRGPDAYFELMDPWILVMSGVLGVAGLGWLARSWWRYGRDRRYKKVYYLSKDPTEETRPLFWHDPLVVEYEPPEQLRPAQIGVLLDESADTKDIAATIVDLAVRRYISIREVPGDGLFAAKDWLLSKTTPKVRKPPLEPYERIVLGGLFADTYKVRVSELKGTFFATLAKAEDALYDDVAKKGLFREAPPRVRERWIRLGAATFVAGALLTYVLGWFFGAGILGLPVFMIGLLLALTHRAMPQRSALGGELLWRALGFRLYLETAETARLSFAERENIFAEYLPYAMVFGSVSKWARAFRDIDTAKAASAWYIGLPQDVSGLSGRLDTIRFSRDLQAFTTNVGRVAAASGESAFSGGDAGGGGAGGGGGGGGGGSW